MDDDPLDPMDPAAYSDVPRGTWTTGNYLLWTLQLTVMFLEEHVIQVIIYYGPFSLQ